MADKATPESVKPPPEIDGDKASDFITRYMNKKKAAATKQGEAGQFFGDNCEKLGLHAEAMRFLAKLDGKAEETRADILRTLKPVLEHFEAHRWNEQPDMLGGGADAEKGSAAMADKQKNGAGKDKEGRTAAQRAKDHLNPNGGSEASASA